MSSNPLKPANKPLITEAGKWARHPESSHPGLIQRDEARERKIWDEQIQPVLKKLGLNFEYQFIEKEDQMPFTEVDIWKFDCWTAKVCRGYQVPKKFNNCIEYIMARVHQNRELRKEDKERFGAFLDEIINDLTLPAFLERLSRESAFSNPKEKKSEAKKLRPCQEDKAKIQEIAKGIWAEYEILDISHLKKHPEILKITGRGKLYKGRNTVHGWLSEVAPLRAKEKGIRPPEARKQQKKICKDLGII